MRPIAVVGSLARDLVGDEPPRVGGAPWYCGRALRVLSRPALIVTKCAEDDRELLLRPLSLLGLPVEWRRASATTVFTHRYEGEHRDSALLQIGEPWSPAEARGWVADTLGRTEWVHAGALVRSDFAAGTLAELARARRVSFEGQGLVRASQTGPLRQDADYDPDALRHVSILKLSEPEAYVLVGDQPDEAGLRSLGVPEVVVTLGSRGALVLSRGHLEHVPGRAVEGVTDFTGAGDAFAAFYVANRAAGVAPTASASRAGALVASLLGGRLR